MTELTFIQGGDDGRRVWRRRLGAADSSSTITVLNGKARRHWITDATGAFSIKWMPRGRAVYRSEGASHFLSGDHAVILNQAQPYELEFLEPTGAESFCVFVSDDLVESAWRDIAEPDAVDDDPAAARTPQFPDLVFRPPQAITGELARLRSDFEAGDPSALAAEERMLALVRELVASAQGHRGLAGRLPAARASTRRLLAARIERARELIESSAETPTLDELARVAAVSKFHLLRLFSAAFGCTPSAYAGRRRMQRGRQLLEATSMSVAAIGEALGYESAGAFIRAFRRHFGVTPSAIRV
jgi:AraC family transcriptional regulator